MKYGPSFGSQALMLIFFQYLLCSFATSQMVSDSTSDATRGGNSGGASPNNIRPTANAQLESDSSVYPPCSHKERIEKENGFVENSLQVQQLPFLQQEWKACKSYEHILQA